MLKKFSSLKVLVLYLYTKGWTSPFILATRNKTLRKHIVLTSSYGMVESTDILSLATQLSTLSASDIFAVKLLLLHKRNEIENLFIEPKLAFIKHLFKGKVLELVGSEHIRTSKFYTIKPGRHSINLISLYTGKRGHKTMLFKEKMYRFFDSAENIQQLLLYLNIDSSKLIERAEAHLQNQKVVEYELRNLSEETLEDIISELLKGVSFLPLMVSPSIEIATKDLGSTHRISLTGISFDAFIENALEEADTNGLASHGIIDSIKEIRELKSRVQEFIQKYSSVSQYKQKRKNEIKLLEAQLGKPDWSVYIQYGFLMDTVTASKILEHLYPKAENGNTHSTTPNPPEPPTFFEEDIPF